MNYKKHHCDIKIKYNFKTQLESIKLNPKFTRDENIKRLGHFIGKNCRKRKQIINHITKHSS